MVAASRTDRTRLGVVAVSAAAHALAFILLLRHLGGAPETPETPVLQVRLVPPWPTDARRKAAPTPSPSPPGRDLPSAPPRHLPPADTRVEPAPAAPAWSPDAVRMTLRALTACDPATAPSLPTKARRRCEDRLAAARAGDALPTRLDLSRGGAFAGRDPEPYLARKPTKGCKVRAGGDADHLGNEGAAAGIACAWPF